MEADKPSVTALGVAVARSTLDRPATPTGDPAADDALTGSLVEQAGDLDRWRVDARDDGELLALLVWVTVRTTFFDQAVLDAIERGTDQVLVLGAGYDGRSLRFRAPGVAFFEVDHPATQRDKRARLDRLHIATDDITFVAADFTEAGLGDSLAAAGHRRERPSLFLLEGVLRYLPEPWFRELLAVVAARSAPGSVLAASISTRPTDEDPEAVAARLAHEQRVADGGEPVLTVPEREVALRWLAEAGWVVDDLLDASDRQPGTRPGRLLVRAHPADPG